MKRKTRKADITADRAAFALHVLIADGKLTAKDVADALRRREQMIRDLRQRLLVLEQGVVSAMRGAGKKNVRKVSRKPKRRMTAARRAALKMHGRYLGHIRTLPTAARVKVKAIRGKSGVRAAIRAARKLSKRAEPRGKARQRNQGAPLNYQNSLQRKLARYQERERPKPDKHGGSGSGRQQGGSGAGREHG